MPAGATGRQAAEAVWFGCLVGIVRCFGPNGAKNGSIPAHPVLCARDPGLPRQAPGRPVPIPDDGSGQPVRGLASCRLACPQTLAARAKGRRLGWRNGWTNASSIEAFSGAGTGLVRIWFVPNRG